MDELRHFLDGVSIIATIATLAGWLPPLAALASIIWICFQFYHSQPVKEWRIARKGKVKRK